MSVEFYERESTIPIWSFNFVGTTATSPSEGVTITITDADGTAQVTDAAMTEDETGDFVYYYTTTSSSAVGTWYYSCLSQDGTGATAKYLKKSGSFIVR
jgi:hypothetical protein